jgi:hypothetical protein
MGKKQFGHLHIGNMDMEFVPGRSAQNPTSLVIERYRWYQNQNYIYIYQFQCHNSTVKVSEKSGLTLAKQMDYMDGFFRITGSYMDNMDSNHPSN